MGGFDRINGVASDPDEYVGSGGAKGEISSVLHINTTQAGTPASTDETTLATYSLPANTLNADNRGLRIIAFGTVANNANNKTIRLKFGTTTLATIGPGAFGSVTRRWVCTAHVIRTGASTEIGYAKTEVSADQVNENTLTTPSDSTAAAISIAVTGENGTASENDVVFRCLIVEALN